MSSSSAIRTIKALLRQFKFRAIASSEPECWDAMRNEITAIPFERTGDKTVEFSLGLEPLESVLVVFQQKSEKRPTRIEAGARPLRGADRVGKRTNPAPAKGLPILLNSQYSNCLRAANGSGSPKETRPPVRPPETRYFRQLSPFPLDEKSNVPVSCLPPTAVLCSMSTAKRLPRAMAAAITGVSIKKWKSRNCLQECRNVLAGSCHECGQCHQILPD